MEDIKNPLNQAFCDYNPIGEYAAVIKDITNRLAQGGQDKIDLTEILKKYGIRSKKPLKKDFLDIILHYMRLALEDHRFTDDEMDVVQDLKSIFEIEEGDFYKYCRNHMRNVISLEMLWMLKDEKINKDEGILNYNIQKAFDLGYDQFLELTGVSVGLVVDRIIEKAEKDPTRKSKVMNDLMELRPILKLSAAQFRRLDMLAKGQ